MHKMQHAARVLAILAFVFILVGCSTPTVVVQPTQDIAPVRTEAAKTVVAKITIQAALNPTATEEPTQAPAEPIVITATPEPATPTAETPAEATATPTQAKAAGSSAGASGTTATRAPYIAEIITQYPADGTVFSPGEDFDGTWTIINTGTSTWTTNYNYRLSGGDDFAINDYYGLGQEVAPGQRITISADMEAPSTAGRYTSYWELRNENGDVFLKFYMVIDVE